MEARVEHTAEEVEARKAMLDKHAEESKKAEAVAKVEAKGTEAVADAEAKGAKAVADAKAAKDKAVADAAAKMKTAKEAKKK